MDWTTISAIAVVAAPLAALLLHLLGILGKLGAFIARVWRAMFAGSTSAAHPLTTLIVIQQPRSNSLWWHMGSTGKAGPHQPPLPMMQVCADVNVTNIWTANATLAGALLRYRPWWSPFARIERGNARIFNGGTTITPNSMQWVRANFLFKPPWKMAGNLLVADLAVIDQFNNHHWLKRARFPYT